MYYFDSYSNGVEDSYGRIIEEVIHHFEGKYIIYFVENDYINAHFIDSDDANIVFSEKFESLLSEIDLMNLNNTKRNMFVRINIAEAVLKELRNHDELACAILISTIDRMKARFDFEKFISFVFGAGIPTLIVSMLSLYLVLKRVVLDPFFLNGLFCVSFSCMGSIFYN